MCTPCPQKWLGLAMGTCGLTNLVLSLSCHPSASPTPPQYAAAAPAPAPRWFGVALGTCGSVNLVLSTRDHDKRAVKDALKVAGAGWAVSSAMQAYNANVSRCCTECVLNTCTAPEALSGRACWPTVT